MRTATLYHVPSGAVLGHVSGPDEADFSGYAEGDIGVFDGHLNRATEYVIDPTTSGTRTDATGYTYPAEVVLGQDVTVAGLPDPCWLRVDGEFYPVTGGSVTRTPAQAREFGIELVGQWRGEFIVSVVTENDDALANDPRWQALRDATPAQIETWLTNNVTSLASAREVLKILILAVRRLGA